SEICFYVRAWKCEKGIIKSSLSDRQPNFKAYFLPLFSVVFAFRSSELSDSTLLLTAYLIGFYRIYGKRKGILPLPRLLFHFLIKTHLRLENKIYRPH